MRDACMARIGAALASIESARDTLLEALQIFVDPEEDDKGEIRAELLQAADEDIGLAAIACQKAQGQLESTNYTEGEPDHGDEEEE